MKKFMVLYHIPNNAKMETSNMSSEEQAKGIEAWMAWAQKCGDRLVDMGSPLANGLSLTLGGGGASDKGVAGYSILQANNMEEATALLKGHPHLDWNAACSIEVHETMSIPGM